MLLRLSRLHVRSRLFSIVLCVVLLLIAIARVNKLGFINHLAARADDDLANHLKCAQYPHLISTFCVENTLSGKRKHLSEVMNVIDQCNFSIRGETSGVYWWDIFPNKDYSELNASISYNYAAGTGDDSASIEGRQYLESVPKHSVLQVCQVEDQQSPHHHWTIDRFGPMVGLGGYDWHTFIWNDAGLFATHVRHGPVWISGYTFMPMSSSNIPLGLPPVHIHHEHVTSSQDAHRYKRGEILGTVNNADVLAVEFDVHGDRQCTADQGGVACLPIRFPDGFGTLLTQQMQTFGDLNDVRPYNSAPLRFYIIHAYRWTHTQQRQVGRLVTAISGQQIGGKVHDTSVLIFDPSSEVMAEYVMWGEFNFAPANLSFIQTFWHTHHEYTQDMWLVKARAATLGLGVPPFEGTMVNITAASLNVPNTMRIILETIDTQNAQLLCVMDQNRWEELDGHIYERLAMAECGGFDMKMHDVVTMISFHSAMKPVDHLIRHWQHAVWYGLYVALEPTQMIPPMIYGILPHVPSARWLSRDYSQESLV